MRAAPLLLLLGACAATPPPSVHLPIPVKCIRKVPAKPVYPVIDKDDGLFVRVQKLLAERELRIAHEGLLEAAITACR